MTTFEFYRFRFHFRALESVRFPREKAGNAIRGALGAALFSIDARLFSPVCPPGASPSGLADLPRPFVLRASHLDGSTVPADTCFNFDVHVFDVSRPLLGTFEEAFAEFAETGLGAPRGRAELVRTEQLHLDSRDRLGPPSVICLDRGETEVRKVTLRFVTATELKSGGDLAEAPEFAILFGRLRDRLSTLRALYGSGPLEIDFRGMGERAAAVRLVRSDLQWTFVKRKSARTGQIHPIGGFTGEAEYEGPLTEFLPWLRAARWVGVGRQTVWGKGDVRVVIP